VNRLSYSPPPLPESLPNRAIKQDERFDVIETLGVERAAPAYPVEPKIVSSAHGRIEHVLLWYGRSAEGNYSYHEIYGELLRALPSATKITFVAHPETVGGLKKLIAAEAPERETTIVTTPDWLAFTVWAEDAFVVVMDIGVDPPITYLLEPERFPRSGDLQIAELVAQASDPIQATQVPLIFQGGNVLIGDKFVLIGRDYLDESISRILEIEPFEDFPYDGTPEAQEDYVREMFRKTFDSSRDIHFLEASPASNRSPALTKIGKEVWLDEVARGAGERQPIFHIDMFVSLAGRDPTTGRYRALVGDPTLANKLLGWEASDHDLAGEFDQIAEQLKGLDFEVTRTPLPHLYADDPTPGEIQVGDKKVKIAGVRRWYHATSNNCLVQIDGDAQDVWLPTYGQPKMEALAKVDAEHKRIWEALGFAVHQLGNFHPFAFSLGALHCIKKYIARSAV
jgi:hypothetical protein